MISAPRDTRGGRTDLRRKNDRAEERKDTARVPGKNTETESAKTTNTGTKNKERRTETGIERTSPPLRTAGSLVPGEKG